MNLKRLQEHWNLLPVWVRYVAVFAVGMIVGAVL